MKPPAQSPLDDDQPPPPRTRPRRPPKKTIEVAEVEGKAEVVAPEEVTVAPALVALKLK